MELRATSSFFRRSARCLAFEVEHIISIKTLIADLPETLRAELTALNPAAQDLSELNARLIVLHGRADPIIPYTESLAMAEAIADEQVRLFVIDGLAHVELKPERRDLPALLSAIDALLAERGVASK